MKSNIYLQNAKKAKDDEQISVSDYQIDSDIPF